ncbi:hypothetical protein BGX26_002819 [Mortierella sp. AD094]|nr:hypothetical protein BGX26_002819 [Mortierella sp. AD094]
MHSSVDGVAAPGSPYLEFINKSFSTNNDLSLPDRVITSPSISNSTKPRDPFMNSRLKHGNKDALRTDIPYNTQVPLQQDTLARIIDNPFQASDGSLSSASTSVSSPSQHKSILKQNRGNGNAAPAVPNNTRPASIKQQYLNSTTQPQYNNVNNANYNNGYGNNGGQHNNNNYLPPTAATAAAAGLTRPASPFAMQNSSTGSSEGRENANSVSSTHRSSRNLAPATDPNYNLTQTDLTLDGLAQRWYAYQAMWKKRYADEPFYKRWTKSKWILLFSAILLLGYSVCILTVAIGYITLKWDLSAVAMTIHSNIIYLSLAGSILGIVSAIIGLVGIFLENRTWLSIYTILLWPVFALYVSVGYIAFRLAHSHLRAHTKDDWIHKYTRDQRLIVQQNLKCCGFQNPSWYAEYDLRCFPMTVLPGCQHKFSIHEMKFLTSVWTISFSIVPVQLFVMTVALLCSNHVDGMLRSGRPGLRSFKEEKND